MSTQLSPVPVAKFFDNNGLPLAGGKLYSYAAGTSTPQATYTDSTGNTPNTNPIILNFRGECALWLDPTLSYKLNLMDSAGNQIPGWPVDSISGPLELSESLTPSVSNTFSIGSALYTWANGYFGTQVYVDGVPIYSETANIVGYYGRTAAELAAGVAPVNYAYPPGSFYRYGAKGGAARISDGTVTAASAVVSSPSGGFANAMAGMTCVVVDGGASRIGGRPAPLITTIASVQSANQITLNVSVTQPGTVTMTGTLNGTTSVTGTSVNPITVGIGLARIWSITGTDIPTNTTIAGTTSSTLTLSQAATGSGSQFLTLTATIEVCFGWDDSTAILAAASLPYPLVPVVDTFLMTQPLVLNGTGCNNFFMPPASLLIFAISNNTSHCVTISGLDRATTEFPTAPPYLGGVRYLPFEHDFAEIDCCNTGLDGIELLQSQFSTLRARVTSPFRNALGEFFLVDNEWQESNQVTINCSHAGLHFHHKVNKANAYQNLGAYAIHGRGCGMNSVYLGINASTQPDQCGGAIRMYAGGDASYEDGGINQNSWGGQLPCELDGERAVALSYGSDICNSPITIADASMSYVIEGTASAHYSNEYFGNFFGMLVTEDITVGSDSRGGYAYYAMVAPTSTTILAPVIGTWGEYVLNSTWYEGVNNLSRAGGGGGSIIYGSGSGLIFDVTPAGIAAAGSLGINGNSLAAQVAGWGAPTGASVQANYSGSAATLAETSAAVAEIITALKALGLFGA